MTNKIDPHHEDCRRRRPSRTEIAAELCRGPIRAVASLLRLACAAVVKDLCVYLHTYAMQLGARKEQTHSDSNHRPIHLGCPSKHAVRFVPVAVSPVPWYHEYICTANSKYVKCVLTSLRDAILWFPRESTDWFISWSVLFRSITHSCSWRLNGNTSGLFSHSKIYD